MGKKIKLILFIFGFIAFATTANFVFAQGSNDAFGIERTGTSLGGSLGEANTSPLVVGGRIIQIILSFLGLIALVLTIYAGWLWMTSGGEENKVTRAKDILRNAVIGLLIILTAWGVTTFILNKIMEATGVRSLGGGENRTNNFSTPGMGAIGACTVSTFYPEDKQTDIARNSAIIISFKEEIKKDSVCINDSGVACECGVVDNGKTCNKINPQTIRIYKTDLGDACASGSCPSANANLTDISASISSDKKTLILTPLTYLGNSSDNIWYSVKFSNSLKKNDGTSMFKTCSVDYFNWKFEVSNRLDLSSPQVVYGKIFPRPDNSEDLVNESQAAVAAKSVITFAACPNVYASSSIVSVDAIGSSPKASASPLNYQGNLTKFKVVISSDSKDRAQLFDGNNDKNLLGAADFDDNGQANFNGFFILKALTRNLGNSWLITLVPEKTADTLTVGDEIYTFSSGASKNNNIQVPASCTANSQANSAYAVLSGNPLITPEYSANKITLTAKVAGTSGNDININTTNQGVIQTQVFKGGVDKKDLSQIADKRDVPMNTVIQLNFNEAINPLKISGLASEIKDYIKVVNYDSANAKASGSVCEKNSQCLSYKCQGSAGAKKCIGDYVDGKFLVSNSYKTVEFISNNECGVNGCGEKIYCLPANSVLSVELKSADLRSCSTNEDCVALSPFNTCSSTPLGYNTCQNSENKNYPSSANSLNGIIDTSLNSFDGDRNTFADGPLNSYSDNYDLLNPLNANKRDNYNWHFYVNDQINLTPPQIESISPSQGMMGVGLADPIKVIWNTLMMNSSLVTGSTFVHNGSSTVEHKLVNLKSSSASALGYWIDNDNIDTEPLDGEPDKTISWIKHTPFAESMSYRAQVGSGVKDIYQNCFKPSAGVSCQVTETNPSCCFGKATSTLGADGNCR